jgi:serine/threonine-protein kinase PpkA
MASVYLAIQESLERRVALKIMAAALGADTSFCKRFLKEGRIIAQLSHPHIITIFDIGVFQDHYYMAMEYLGGGSLKERLLHKLSVEECLLILEQIAKPLGYAHKHGFIHRDVKPANILFRKDGSAVLSDFGIAKGLSDNTQLTAMGWTLGTPNYMSPEQALGQPVDARSDLYSLGIVFFEILTGTRPYQAEDSFRTAMLHVQEPIPRLPKPLAHCQDLVDRLMAKKPDDRFFNAEELVEAIEHLRSPKAPTLSSRSKKQKEKQQSAAPARSSQRLTRRWLYGFGLVGVLVAAIGVTWYVILPLLAPANTGLPTPSSTQAPAPTISPVAEDCPTLGQAAQEQITGLMGTAQAHEEAGFLFYAADVYQRILELDPCETKAKNKLQLIANRYEAMAQDSLAENDHATSLELVKTGLQVMPNHAGLRTLQEDILAQSPE